MMNCLSILSLTYLNLTTTYIFVHTICHYYSVFNHGCLINSSIVILQNISGVKILRISSRPSRLTYSHACLQKMTRPAMMFFFVQFLSGCKNGKFPDSITWRTTPKLQMSVWCEWTPLRRISGEQQAMVPNLSVLVWPLNKTLERPKSIYLGVTKFPLNSSMIFSSLMSLWTTPT